MKINKLIRFVIEIALSFIIKMLAEHSIRITGDTNVDHTIFSIISFSIIAFSLFNFAKVLWANKQNKSTHKLNFFDQMLIYIVLVACTILIWFLITQPIFWVIFGCFCLSYIIVYIKNRDYRKELSMYKKAIKRILNLEYNIQKCKLKVDSKYENIISIEAGENSYTLLTTQKDGNVFSNDDINSLVKQLGITVVPTEDGELFITMRFLTLILLEKTNKEKVHSFDISLQINYEKIDIS